MAETKKTMLIFEPNLVENSGHHYTQISALSRLFPEFGVKIVAGENYSGFLGEAVARVNSAQLGADRLRKKVKSTTSFKKYLYTLRFMRHSALRRVGDTTYGDVLLAACNTLRLGTKDVVVVPSADLDSLESVHWLANSLGAQSPKIVVRFLTPDLGENDDVIRKIRLNALQPSLSSGALNLFTETPELAKYIFDVYGISSSGGFYLPCNFDPSQITDMPKCTISSTKKKKQYRVGLFGLPKRRKGSHRLAAILASVEKNRPPENDCLIEFVVQGSSRDFSAEGLYGQLGNNGRIRRGISVKNVGEHLSPPDFKQVFSSVDMVMLPYDIAKYGLQGSGVVQDALAELKPIIYSQGMAMSDLLNERSSLSAVTDSDFAKAVWKVIRDPNLLKPSRVDAAERYKNMLVRNPLREIL